MLMHIIFYDVFLKGALRAETANVLDGCVHGFGMQISSFAAVIQDI